MTLDDAMVSELSDRYFDGKMPERLKAYLLDHYGIPSLRCDMDQNLDPGILNDIEAYKIGRLDMKIKTSEEVLQQQFDELSDMYSEAMDQIRTLESEQSYLFDFLSNFNLHGLYRYFKENAHEATDEVGLKYLTI